jgi:hypothetical protein
MILFITGFLQVFFVAWNTYNIAHEKYIGCIIIGFFISLTWSFNVKKIAFGSFLDRIKYCFGAAIGSLSGLLIAMIIYR